MKTDNDNNRLHPHEHDNATKPHHTTNGANLYNYKTETKLKFNNHNTYAMETVVVVAPFFCFFCVVLFYFSGFIVLALVLLREPSCCFYENISRFWHAVFMEIP